jgi:PIN domain nuclease of toxin-antitoxin system
MVSAASAWEVSTKFRLGRLPTAVDLVGDFEGYLTREQFASLPVSVEHGMRAGLLPGTHRDPFDRMLAAQAQIEGLVLVSNDGVFDSYGVRRMW